MAQSENSVSQAHDRLPLTVVGAACCFVAWPLAFGPVGVAAMYAAAFQQAVESERSERFRRRYQPNMN